MERFLKPNNNQNENNTSTFSKNSSNSRTSQKEEHLREDYLLDYYNGSIPNSLENKELQTDLPYNNVDFKRDLNEEQLEIVDNIKGPMLVIAGAGSGKTRTIVYAVAKLLLTGAKPNEIMLVTFTNKAANEMITRVETLLGTKPKGIWAGTFHSISNRFIRKYTKLLGLKPNYTILDESDSNYLMKLAMEKAKVDEIDIRFPTSKKVKSILSYTINCNKSIRNVVQWKYNHFDDEKILSKLKHVFDIYRQKKAINNLVDFDDLLVYWNKLLDERSVAQLIARNIKYVLVDEYQDTNYIQDEIISKIVLQNPQHNIIAVGDDAQSIYAFRGANFKNILNFSKKFEGCKIYNITYNYRSVPEILNLATNSINHNQNQFKKEMNPIRLNGIKPYQMITGDDEEQARFISNQILKLNSEGYELNEIAVLYRAGFHSFKIELELQSKNLPYIVRSGVSFFEKAHIKDIISYLRIIENPYDELSWIRIFTMVQGIGRNIASRISEEILNTESPIATINDPHFFSVQLRKTKISSNAKRNFIFNMKNLINFNSDDNPSEAILKITTIIKDYIRNKYGNWQDRMEDLNQLANYARNYQSIQKFLEFLSLNQSNIESKLVQPGHKNNNGKSIILSTIHRAKGLEWRVVFIPMLSEGYFPSSRVKDNSEEFEEERRIFYVAVTRAKDQLYLMTPLSVYSNRGARNSKNSQFMSELNPNTYQELYYPIKTETELQMRINNDLLPKKRKSKFPAQFISADSLIKEKERKP
jgi:DNA helicase-2/ATP-dependent DNA helicase PcrA